MTAGAARVDAVGAGRWAAAVGAGLLLLAIPVCGGAGVAGWWFTREPDRLPPVAYRFEVPPAERTVQGIDLLDLHRERWPAVVVARDPDGRAAAAAAVAAGVGGDDGLQTVARQLVDALDADPRTAADAAEVWNAALGARGMRFALQAGGRPPHAYLKSYWLAAEPTVRAGDRATTVRVGLRVDRLNVVEGWLGLAEDVGGAIVVVDRVRDFATDDLWPRLDPADPAPLSVALRADLAARLPPAATALLAEGAAPRRGLLAAVDAVEGRRASCGSTFVLRVPWDGVEDLATLRAWADADDGASCPGVTHPEVDAIAAASRALRAAPGLPAALEALVGLAGRHVALHEAQHRLDHEDWGFGVPPPCAGACAHLSPRAQVEASAYLAALASPEATVAWIQACEVLAAGQGGSAADALDRLGSALGTTCDAPPPADLADRARALAGAWFGPRPDLSLERFPDTLPLGLRSPPAEEP